MTHKHLPGVPRYPDLPSNGLSHPVWANFLRILTQRDSAINNYIVRSAVTSSAFAIDSTGVKTVTVQHQLGTIPALEEIQISLVEDTAVDDWACDWIKVVSTGASTITAKVKVGTASATGGATAKLNFRIEG